MKNLPNVPSELIRLAIADMKLCEADPRYKIELGEWHTPSADVCLVCCGGAVMAKSLDAPIHLEQTPSSFGEYQRHLTALDNFRWGDIWNALNAMGITVPDGVDDTREIARYKYDVAGFYDDMESIAQHLEDHGL